MQLAHVHHGFAQLAGFDGQRAAHSGQQAAGQRRREPASIVPLQRDIAARALGDLTRFIPQNHIEHAAVGRRLERRVMPSARGFVADELAVRGFEGTRCERQGHRLRGRCKRKGLGLELAFFTEQQPHAPLPRGMSVQQALQRFFDHGLGPCESKMRGRRAHARQMPIAMQQLAVFQRKCLQHL